MDTALPSRDVSLIEGSESRVSLLRPVMATSNA
jgi:hypothetical protein